MPLSPTGVRAKVRMLSLAALTLPLAVSTIACRNAEPSLGAGPAPAEPTPEPGIEQPGPSPEQHDDTSQEQSALDAVPDQEGAEEIDRGFQSVVVAAGFEQATAFAFAADERIFVAEKEGAVRVVHRGVLLPEPFVDLRQEVNAAIDRGLLGVAVHPDFPAKPYVYLLYTYDPPETSGRVDGAGPDGAGARASRLLRLEADADHGYARARPGSAIVLLGTHSSYEHMGRPDARNDYERPSCGTRGAYVRDCLPADEVSHSVGTLAFGPDGSLYVANGDGCDFQRAQPACTRALDLDSLAGKILRIDPLTGAGLRDNPFADDDLDSNRSKVYQLGLRNPFRFTFDHGSRALYVGDVGWNTWEEINRAGAGANFGWPCYEGGNGISLQQPSYQEFARCAELAASGEPITPALYAYAHEGPGQGSAVLVGDVYRGTRYPPLYRGALFYSDFNRRELRYLSFDAAGNVASSHVFAEGIGYPSQISADPSSGDLFMLQINAGDGGPEGGRLERLVFAGYGRGPAVDRLYTVRTSENQCIEAVANGDSADGREAALEARPCSGGAGQRWLFESAGEDLYRFESETLKQTITMAALELEQPELWLTPRADVPEQRFRLFPLEQGFQVISEANELCLSTSSDESGARIVPARCASTPAQLFEVASEANRRPTVSAVPSQTGTVGDAVQLKLSAEDAEGGELTFFASGLPAGVSIDPQAGFAMGVLTKPGKYNVRVRVTDGELEASTTFTWTVNDHKLPDVVIETPGPAELYVPGTLITFTGSARDHQGSLLPPSSLSWQLYTHHNQHVHFGGLPATYGTSGSFTYEDHGDNTSLELCLSAVDAERRTGRACRLLLPLTVEYTVDTVPSGLTIPWEGVPHETPFTVQTNVGSERDLIAPLVQNGHVFVGWSDGGAASHAITIGSAPTTLTATYTAPTP